MATSLQVEPTPLGETTAPAFESAREEGRSEQGAQVNQAADTANPGLGDNAPVPTSTSTEGARTSESEPLPSSTSPTSPTSPTNPPTPGRQSTDGHFAKVPGVSARVLEKDENAPTFKEKVQGFAKIFRGGALGKEELKAEGRSILTGERKASSG
ncbi:hypothetical protein DACRYDRAFT_106029 [Dacryopinax primogenitus]|uniref:Uncharacterized protein n=1 Tax=Dacryopinax primogenitus (strain DJM 731) TaxID=1858805 RepID=M5GCG3_DACPD|nr:uncharacterized protein DACRYDRAFT_106029 [Dacryopinax primogenitus]EJU03872.1 hypothetical protein DACRYDRAFT_106029 [Dacryopinax primogenitus]